MAKVKNPLHSLQASGSIGKKLTFRTTPGASVAQRHAVPTGQPSSNQIRVRQKFKDAQTTWLALDSFTRTSWINLALGKGQQGSKLFTKEYIRQNIAAPNLPKIPAQ